MATMMMMLMMMKIMMMMMMMMTTTMTMTMTMVMVMVMVMMMTTTTTTTTIYFWHIGGLFERCLKTILNRVVLANLGRCLQIILNYIARYWRPSWAVSCHLGPSWTRNVDLGIRVGSGRRGFANPQVGFCGDESGPLLTP